ncbi:glutathione peroxidase [Jeongeupia naejangsanensis]|uniref:Glutathione peroxidase n=1 Tax=Jeongeupia naejangsanensis TaxID=613195 RepID=A0ABS2BKZ0_9NEIS|nr:glutathione peroxidase [Jeongeupia naejangsanensis]MBM3116276.1 glutathione peroxidase [Jeongeupia naejangsanensis]
MSSLYDFTPDSLAGQPQPLAEYRDQVLLIVNVASKCGFTPQYAGLQALYERFKDRGFAVLGFPCNQFGSQEPGDAAEIGSFCEQNYGVSFPMFAKIDVNGDGAHPLYQFLKKAEPGILGTEGIKWNFTKFLINREGQVIERFAPTTSPEDLVSKIESLL